MLGINRKNEKTVKLITVGKHLCVNKPFMGKYFTQITGLPLTRTVVMHMIAMHVTTIFSTIPHYTHC